MMTDSLASACWRSNIASALAAVDGDRRAGDPAGARRGEERDEIGDFLRPAEAAERNLAANEVGDALGIFLLPLPPGATLEGNRSRRHRVDADVVSRELLRHRF